MSMFVLALALAMFTIAPPASEADSHVFNRGISNACTSYAQSVGSFPDIAADATHAGAIDCLAHWGIVQGRQAPDGDLIYVPGDTVDRAAMASFVVQAIERLPTVTVPEPSDDRFGDYEAGTHADNVHVLRAADIVSGREDGTYAHAPR